MLYIDTFGINLWDEYHKEGDEKLFEAKDLKINTKQISSTAIYAITTKDNKLQLSSSLNNQTRDFKFNDNISKICHTNDNLFILLNDGNVHQINFIELNSELIHQEHNVIDISCTHLGLYALTSQNHFYQLQPNVKLLLEFPRHQKIKKIVSGVEHTILMTGNGDLFSFGCGLRGSLGHGDVNSLDTPKLVDALAGIKIVDIAAGSFHSIAVSSFGDIYAWGWNTNGQLGLSTPPKLTLKSTTENRQQVFTLPQLIELEDNVEPIFRVLCGSKHTILRSERNRIFVAGLNNYGQLGLSSELEDVDKFTEMPYGNVNDTTQISCGYWSTFLINEN